MILPPLIAQLNDKLKGLPDYTLTAILFTVSLFGMLVALFGEPLLKAGVAAWFLAP
jgi:lysylphosphatidylglycerol synthetase-like protein (DUF2156 family)